MIMQDVRTFQERIPYDIKRIVEEGTTFTLETGANLLNRINGCTLLREKEPMVSGGVSGSGLGLGPLEILVLFIGILVILVFVSESDMFYAENIVIERGIYISR